MSNLTRDPIIIAMAKYLRHRLALTTDDFDWKSCARGFRKEYLWRGGNPSISEREIAEGIHDVLEHMELFNVLGHLTQGRPRKRRENMTENLLPPDRVKNVCRWEPLTAWARRTEGEILVTEIECASCHSHVSVEEAHTTIAVGVHGDDLPLPGFMHCSPCMLRMDPTHAWYLAKAEADGQIGRRD